MRRGNADLIEWIPRLVLMLVAIMVIVVLVKYFTDRELPDEKVHAASVLYRIYYDDLIMYVDPVTKRAHPGIVDIKKLENINLEEIFAQINKGPEYAIRLVVMDSGKCSIQLSKDVNQYPAKYAYESTFNSYYSFIRSGVSGHQSGQLLEVALPVTFKDDSQECTGKLNISIVRSNT